MLLAAGMLLSLGGCASYRLRGRVVQGTFSHVEVVEASDPRLKGEALQGTVLTFTIDPDSLGAKPQGQTSSDSQGRFAKPIDVFGAGFLEYRVRVVARRSGQSPAVGTVDLPGSGKRLLVTLTPGEDDYQGPTDVVEDTLKLGKPYLEGR